MTQIEIPPAQASGPRTFYEEKQASSRLQRVAWRLTEWTERWFPDAYVIALIALVTVTVAALLIGASPTTVVNALGAGYWDLIPFTYQMAMIIVTGFALAACRPIHRGINYLASIPKTGHGAIAFVIFLSLCGSFLNWGFGMIFSAFLVIALSQRKELRMDFRAAAAAGLMGTTTTSMVGLSSSAALLHATPTSLPPALLKLAGEIPLAQTIFLWQNWAMTLIVMTVTILIGYLTAPRGSSAYTAEDLGIDTSRFVGAVQDGHDGESESRPGDWLSVNPILAVLVGLFMATWIGLKVSEVGFGRTISSLNNYIFIVLTAALLLHGQIRKFLRAANDAIPATGAILIQFPVYAAVASILTRAKNAEGTSVSDYLGHFFISSATEHTLPVIVGIYSSFAGMFIPSAGAKWVLEAPYILHAGNEIGSNLGWLINTYGLTEALAGLLNPFWMLPLLGLLSLRARSVVGYTFVYFLFLFPTSLLCVWLLSYTLPYTPPVMP
ncbi:TIGR00366 family protein [Caballeronia cordobensis]|uniref:TIGR00366 family protein n=1 Tax=Caballeronia cordobensis TaxID=1353886 RepID=UPI00045F0CF2|nr:putative membrane protein [Burkholderia sp. RPE67]